MELIIIKDNKNNLNTLDYLDNIENIEVPSIPIDIIELFIKDYKFMAKFLDYKRDATLALLNIYNGLNIYDDNFNIKIEKEFKNFWDFFELLKKYSKIFTKEGLNFYANKNINNNHIKIIDEKFLGPIVEKIFDNIYHDYLKKFPDWCDKQKQQNEYININLKNKIDINNIRYYWNFQGVIYVQDTNYGKLINDIFFKIEFNGTPKFQIVSFDLNILKYFKTIEKNLKQYIDKIDDKIISQNLKKMELDLDDIDL